MVEYKEINDIFYDDKGKPVSKKIMFMSLETSQLQYGKFLKNNNA